MRLDAAFAESPTVDQSWCHHAITAAADSAEGAAHTARTSSATLPHQSRLSVSFAVASTAQRYTCFTWSRLSSAMEVFQGCVMVACKARARQKIQAYTAPSCTGLQVGGQKRRLAWPTGRTVNVGVCAMAMIQRSRGQGLGHRGADPGSSHGTVLGRSRLEHDGRCATHCGRSSSACRCRLCRVNSQAVADGHWQSSRDSYRANTCRRRTTAPRVFSWDAGRELIVPTSGCSLLGGHCHGRAAGQSALQSTSCHPWVCNCFSSAAMKASRLIARQSRCEGRVMAT